MSLHCAQRTAEYLSHHSDWRYNIRTTISAIDGRNFEIELLEQDNQNKRSEGFKKETLSFLVRALFLQRVSVRERRFFASPPGVIRLGVI